MSGSYNLRSLQRKKGILVRNCHLHTFTGSSLPEAFNPKVCLERLKFLECHDMQNRKFYLKNGRILIKRNNCMFLSEKFLLKILCLILIVALIFIMSSTDWRGHLQNYSNNFVKKCSGIYPAVQKFYPGAVKIQKRFLKQFNYIQPKPRSKNKKSDFIILDASSEIRDIVRDYFAEIKNKSKIQKELKSSNSFIEEQCRTNTKYGSNTVKNFYNTTLLDAENLNDYALESKGAKIVTVYDTELYGPFTVKFLNLRLWPRVSHLLMKYVKGFSSKGPNAVLKPWTKPGDCWAFKGSRGRVQIELSEDIIITAVSIDHIPKEITPEGNIESAPKGFSILGVKEFRNQIKTYLGTFEYKSTGPSTQTFPIQTEGKNFRQLEVVIESNHGNSEYTCVYKIRVHGHK